MNDDLERYVKTLGQTSKNTYEHRQTLHVNEKLVAQIVSTDVKIRTFVVSNEKLSVQVHLRNLHMEIEDVRIKLPDIVRVGQKQLDNTVTKDLWQLCAEEIFKGVKDSLRYILHKLDILHAFSKSDISRYFEVCRWVHGEEDVKLFMALESNLTKQVYNIKTSMSVDLLDSLISVLSEIHGGRSIRYIDNQGVVLRHEYAYQEVYFDKQGDTYCRVEKEKAKVYDKYTLLKRLQQ